MNTAQYEVNPFRIPNLGWITSEITERLLGLRKLSDEYVNRPARARQQGAPFLEYALEALDVKLDIRSQHLLDEVPSEGPTLFVANHPLGGLEGIALAHLLLKKRPDLKVLTNEMLRRVPELSELFIGVDVLSSDGAKSNAKGLRAAHKHLKSGGALLIFPAGMVSAYCFDTKRIADRPWNRIAEQLARKQNATCVPVYIDGRNSSLFYAAGVIHPRLRTALLARELANKQGMKLGIHFGAPIVPNEIQHLKDDQEITHYLRMATEFIQAKKCVPVNRRESDPIDKSVCNQILDVAVKQLDEFHLLDHAEFAVYCAPYKRLGPIMDEIGVAREKTFRSAGEGTGNSRDIDGYDQYYWHLFIWDTEKKAIVGGYRVGRVDEIVNSQGIQGLYSRSLFHYDVEFVSRLGKSLEMGRSFIVPDYQRRPVALDLLWRGIGAIINQNPEYHTLFGPVSVSGEYSNVARALMADSLLENFAADKSYSSKVKPIRPLKYSEKVWSADMLKALSNIKVLNKLIGRCDSGKAVPVMLRHYLSLNGRFACFHVDPEFNNTLAGLVIVDVRNTPDKYLRRYLDKSGAQRFIETHALQKTA
ncbi:MAG: lysophospholipid acyltransferase family protein [Pseudomonadales bacterium]|nr:lysophospholipid acyltransferase family protein [Pseudomonadales bacterium]